MDIAEADTFGNPRLIETREASRFPCRLARALRTDREPWETRGVVCRLSTAPVTVSYSARELQILDGRCLTVRAPMRSARLPLLVNYRRAVAACLTAAVSAVVAGCGGGLTSASVLTAASCSSPKATIPADASPAPSGSVDAASKPLWSADDGRPAVVVGGTAYGPGAEGRCITAIVVATGQVGWSVAAPPDHPLLFSVVADASIVLAATGAEPQQTGGLEAPVIDQLVAYEPTTGQPKWAVDIPGDSQRMPSVLAGSVVVVSEADGSVVGLSEGNGHQLWQVPAPKGCSATNTEDGTEPNAAMLGSTTQGGDLSAVVGYACPAGGGVTAIDPSNGHIRWAWSVPRGWEVDMQEATTVHTGNPGGDVVAAAISLIPPANAPKNVAPPPGPVTPTLIPNTSGSSQTSDVAVLDPGAGRTLWDLTRVVGQLLTAGGSGTLCILTDAGADCRNPRNGAPRWSMSWPGRNATSPATPPLGCIDESADGPPCVATANGLLYVALATASAPVYPPGPDPSTPAGAFQVTALSMNTGKTAATIPLPSFSVQSDHAVSLGIPPAVLLAADGLVLVSPQLEETDEVQAFATPGH
jgi:hypothetical protein